MKSFLQNNNIEMYSMHNEVKLLEIIVAKRLLEP